MKKLDRQLTEAELNYVLYHLNMHFDIGVDIRNIIVIGSSTSASVIFPLEETIEFPNKEAAEIYQVKGNSIEFCHDLIKSSFYLLSGYQEYEDNNPDQWGRSKWENSVQYELNITHIPIVNYYFKWITDAIEQYCIINSIAFKRKNIFSQPVLHLTHDIDTVRYYKTKLILYRFAQVIGLRPIDASRLSIAKAAIMSLLHATHLKKQKNPWWSFNEIINVEKYFGFKSTWFALPDDEGPFSADYKWKDDDIVELFKRIISNGDELGLHGPINCRTKEDYDKYMKELQDNFGTTSTSHRQHFLAVTHDNIKEMDKTNIEIDCSLGYSHSEGWRNSYCLPFHPFDHKSQTMLSIWEVPLAMMDVSMLNHKRLSYDDIFNVCGDMLEETRAFNGIFSVLWHNSTFNETYYPGMLKFFEELHLFFSQYSMTSLTTNDILTKIKRF